MRAGFNYHVNATLTATIKCGTKRCVVALSAGGEHVEEKLDSVDVSLYSSNWFRGHI